VENAVRLLVTRFMPLNSTDLENWMADPEEWANSEGKEDDQWEFEIRVGSTSLLSTVLTCVFSHVANESLYNFRTNSPGL